MNDDIEFLDVALLKRIDTETTVESFGSKISSTFFEAANLLGTLKIKGLIDIHSAIGNSPVLITEKGRLLLKDLDANAENEPSKIDLAVLGSIRGGLKNPKQIEGTLNIKSRDIAYAIYKLAKRGYIDYKVRNAGVELMLTTLGFEEESPTVKEHANRTFAKVALARPEVKGPGEVRNKIAEELATEDFGAESEGEGDVQREDRNISKVLYYADRFKWHMLCLIVVVAAAAIYFLYLRK